MVAYYRDEGGHLSAGSRDSVYHVIHDDFQPDTRDAKGRIVTRGGYPYGRVELRFKRGEGTYPNFDTSAHGNKYYNGESAEFHFRNKESSPTELFTTEPDQIIIDAAYAHPKVRRYIPKMLAIAQADNPQTKLTASSSLSAYSSRLSKNAVEKGLVNRPTRNPEMEAEGEISKLDDDFYRQHYVMPKSDVQRFNETQIPQHDVLKGEQFLREALGRGPKPKPEPQVEHPRLPGM